MSRPSKYNARVIRNLALAGLVTLLLTLSAGCGVFMSTTNPALDLDFSQTLPEDWVPIGTWQEINIDGDGDTEYLLLFTYDQGQAGGAIYDQQIAPDFVGVVDVSATPVATPTVELVPVPLQPLAYYRPYRLLPTSWSYSYGGNVGHGFLALPKDKEEIDVHQVVRVQTTGDGSTEPVTATQVGTQPAAELTILGGETHLTFVWWLNTLHGYAVSQLTAEGGFVDFDWEAWSNAPTPITNISGLSPLNDYRARSLLCRESLYTRTLTATHEYVQSPDMATVAFAEQYRGVRFCIDDGPDHPFYPEGVVMKYLVIADSDATDEELDLALSPLLTPGVDDASLELNAALVQLSDEMVSDISAYPTVPALPPRIVTGDFLPTTTVCVEAAQRAEPDRRRWVLFTLRYQPPDFAERLPDRWTISGAEEMPELSGEQPPYECASLLNATVE